MNKFFNSILGLLFSASCFAEPKITIIIDDLGNNIHHGNKVLALPGAITLSILPHTPYAKAIAQQGFAQGKEVMLHAPMSNTQNLPLGPGALTDKQNQSDFSLTLRKALASVPHVRGLNNHMGSQLTQMQQPMQWLMSELQEQNLYFVDSLTTGRSVAWQTAEQNNIQNLKRDIFLDAIDDVDFIRSQYQKLLHVARLTGSAVAIGHPYANTLNILKQELPLLESLGVSLISASALIELTEKAASIKQLARSQSSTTVSDVQ